MKYYTLGITFLILSLLIILLSFYYINLTKKIETELKNAKLEMRYLEDKIQINNIEFAAHIHPKYLERLEEIYLFNKYNKSEVNIVSIKEINFKDLGQVIKVATQ